MVLPLHWINQVIFNSNILFKIKWDCHLENLKWYWVRNDIPLEGLLDFYRLFLKLLSIMYVVVKVSYQVLFSILEYIGYSQILDIIL